MIIWGWVGVSTTPNAFMALGQGTESLKGMKIPRETEIVLGMLFGVREASFKRQVLITNDHSLPSARSKVFA